MLFGKENIYTGTSIENFNKIRNVLELQKIKYEYTVLNHDTDAFLMQSGVPRSMGGNLKGAKNLYQIYISKKDKDEAEYYLKKQNF